jgi:ribosomal protein S27AE
MVYTDIHVKNIQICNIETREEASRVKEIFTIGRSKLKERKYLKIDLLEDNKREYLLFELDKKEMLKEIINQLLNSLRKDFTKEQSFSKKESNPYQMLSNNNIINNNSIIPKLSDTPQIEKYDEHIREMSTNDIDIDDADDDDESNTVVELTRSCPNCNAINDLDDTFCSKCGNKLVEYEYSSKPVNIYEINPEVEQQKEKIIYKENGEVIVKRVEHKGTGRKIASWLLAGPIGYVAIGRDKTRKRNVKGVLTVTNKAIYCSVNVYPFDQIVAITNERNKLLLILDKTMSGTHFTVTLYIRTKHLDRLFHALENARTSHLIG